MAKKTIEQVDVKGKRVLMRVDFNVPLDDGVIRDDRRIRAALPSIRSVLDRGGRLVLMSHLGRPKGEGYEPALSLEPCAKRLSELLGSEVRFPSHDCIDESAAGAVSALGDGEVVMLENLRFHAGEKAGDDQFAAKLTVFGDLYCNDAFGTAHREDASMVAVPRAMEGDPRVCGFLLSKEIKFLSETLESPQRPFVAVLGGAKVSDKIGVVERLITRTDSLLIGGAMAYTFLEAMGFSVGKSRVERSHLADAKRMIELAAVESCDLHLPKDHICSTAFEESCGEIKVCQENIDAGFMGMDIGPGAQGDFCRIISTAKTILWNGPMGVFEWRPYRVGSQQIAVAIAEATQERGAVSIVGGGDTAAAVSEFGVADQVSHVSTGGGASLAMLAGEELVSLSLLDDA